MYWTLWLIPYHPANSLKHCEVWLFIRHRKLGLIQQKIFLLDVMVTSEPLILPCVSYTVSSARPSRIHIKASKVKEWMGVLAFEGIWKIGNCSCDIIKHLVWRFPLLFLRISTQMLFMRSFINTYNCTHIHIHWKYLVLFFWMDSADPTKFVPISFSLLQRVSWPLCD